jgi:hypothetical protein
MFTNKTPFNYGNLIIWCLCISMKKLMVIAAGVLVAACGTKSSKTIPVLAFQPPIDSIYRYTVTILKWQQVVGREMGDTVTEAFTFNLRKMAEHDSLCTMRLTGIGLQLIKHPSRFIQQENGVEFTTDRTMPLDTISTDRPFPDHSAQEPPIYVSYEKTWHTLHTRAMGSPLYIIMNKAGAVLQVKGFDSLVNQVNPPESERPMVRKLLHETLGEKSIVAVMNQLFFYVRNTAIKNGDSWVRTISPAEMVSDKYSYLMTVKNIQAGIATLDIKTAVSATTGIGGEIYNKGKQQGTVVASCLTGMPYSCKLEEHTLVHTDQYDVNKYRTITVVRYPL